jgi:hypothetical protein
MRDVLSVFARCAEPATSVVITGFDKQEIWTKPSETAMWEDEEGPLTPSWSGCA